LAAGASWKLAPVRILCENYLCNPNGSFIPSFFLFLLPYHCHQHYSSLQKVSFNYLMLTLFNV